MMTVSDNGTAASNRETWARELYTLHSLMPVPVAGKVANAIRDLQNTPNERARSKRRRAWRVLDKFK